MPKIRVLTLLHQLSLTGAPKIALDACEAMSGDVDPFFLALEGGDLEERCRALGPLSVMPNNYKVPLGRTAPVNSLLGRAMHGAKRVRAQRFFAGLQQQIAAWKPDVIYTNSVVSLKLFDLMDFPKVPMLLHVHELRIIVQLYMGDDPFSKTRPDKYLAVAEPVRELLMERFSIPADKITLVHEFVPDADLKNSNLMASTDQSTRKDNRFVVGGAGLPGWRKGTTLWLQAAAALTKKLGEDKVRFVWVGVDKGGDSVYFQEEARKLKIDHMIEFVPVTRTPLPHYTDFDVFAMTSYEDPCPLVVLENMMLEKPVLCFAGSGGAPEEVGPTGIVVEDFSPILMAEALADLAAHPERVKALGSAARARVQEQFTASRQVPKILRELQMLAASGKAS